MTKTPAADEASISATTPLIYTNVLVAHQQCCTLLLMFYTPYFQKSFMYINTNSLHTNYSSVNQLYHSACSALMLLVGQQEGIRPVKTEWWCAGVVICLKQGADLHTAQLMPLPITVSCFSKIQIGFTFLVPAHLGSPGQRAVKRVCV